MVGTTIVAVTSAAVLSSLASCTGRLASAMIGWTTAWLAVVTINAVATNLTCATGLTRDGAIQTVTLHSRLARMYLAATGGRAYVDDGLALYKWIQHSLSYVPARSLTQKKLVPPCLPCIVLIERRVRDQQRPCSKCRRTAAACVLSARPVAGE